MCTSISYIEQLVMSMSYGMNMNNKWAIVEAIAIAACFHPLELIRLDSFSSVPSLFNI